MNIFDHLFFGIQQHYKTKKNKNANTIALWYITIVHIALVFILGIFFSEFFRQMRITMFSSKKAWVLFVIVSIAILFKNWVQYSGRKLTIRHAKRSRSKPVDRSIYSLWLVPIALIALSLVLLNIW